MSNAWGHVVYYVEVRRTGCKPGERLRPHRIGPFLSLHAAEAEMFKQKQRVNNTGGGCEVKIVPDIGGSLNRN
jgi:hypothetical protein